MATPGVSKGLLLRLLTTPGATNVPVKLTIRGELQLTAVGVGPLDRLNFTFEPDVTTNLLDLAPASWWTASTSLLDAVNNGWLIVDKAALEAPVQVEQPVQLPLRFATLDENGKVPQSELPTLIVDPLAQSIANALLDSNSVFQIFVDPNGSDTIGDGSASRPFKSLQRVAKPIEDASALNLKLRGQVSVHCAAGDYESFNLGLMNGTPSVNIFFFADIRSTPIRTFSISPNSGLPVPNPSDAGSNLGDCYDYNVGSYPESIGPAQYWIRTGNGIFFDGYVLREDSASPHIRVELGGGGDISTYLQLSTVELRTFNCRILPTSTGGISLTNASKHTFSDGVFVVFEGFQIGSVDAGASLVTEHVCLQPCLMVNVSWQVYPGTLDNEVLYLDIDSSSNVAFTGLTSTGLTCIYRNFPEFVGCYELSVNGRFDQGCQVGGFTDGRPPGATALDFEWCSLRGSISMNGGSARFGDHGICSVEGAIALVEAHGWAHIQLIPPGNSGFGPAGTFGATAGPAVVLEDNAFLVQVPDTLVITNLVNAGQDVLCGSGEVLSFAATPPDGITSGLRVAAHKTTTNATPTEAIRIQMPVDGAIKTISVKAVGSDDTTGAARFVRDILAYRLSGVTNIHTVTPYVDDIQSLGGSPNVTVAVVGTDIVVSLTGIAATTMDWRVRVVVDDTTPQGGK
jgi:hypothetical protein